MSNLPALLGQKEARDNRQYKQHEIAEATGITRSQVSNLWRGKTSVENITLDTAYRLAKWLGCRIDDLMQVIPDEKAS